MFFNRSLIYILFTHANMGNRHPWGPCDLPVAFQHSTYFRFKLLLLSYLFKKKHIPLLPGGSDPKAEWHSEGKVFF